MELGSRMMDGSISYDPNGSQVGIVLRTLKPKFGPLLEEMNQAERRGQGGFAVGR